MIDAKYDLQNVVHKTSTYSKLLKYKHRLRLNTSTVGNRKNMQTNGQHPEQLQYVRNNKPYVIRIVVYQLL